MFLLLLDVECNAYATLNQRFRSRLIKTAFNHHIAKRLGNSNIMSNINNNKCIINVCIIIHG